MFGYTPQQAATTVGSGQTAVANLLNTITSRQWQQNCQLAQMYYQYLEDQIVNAADNGSFVTYEK